MTDALLTGPVAEAFREAEARKAARAAKRNARAAALEAPHVYTLLAATAPSDEAMYEGTGIGFLYGFDATPSYAADLGDWKVVLT